MKLTLDGSSHTPLLKTLDILSGKLASKKRILRERLKVPSTQGMPVHADRGCKENVGLASLCFLGQMTAYFAEKGLVPCGGQ